MDRRTIPCTISISLSTTAKYVASSPHPPHFNADSLLSFQYFTWADRVGGSYRQPESSLDPLLEVKALDSKKE